MSTGTRTTADNIAAYVNQGGVFLTGYMTGMHDENDLIVTGGYPGYLRELCGIWVEEIDAYADGERIPVTFADGTGAHGQMVASIVELEGARSLAQYGGTSFYAGTRAVTVRHTGRGAAYYVGTALDNAAMGHLVDTIAREYHIDTVESAEDVEIVRRHSEDGGEMFIVLNTCAEPRTMVNPYTGQPLALDAFDVRILTRQ